jgi:hypothetical protein
MKAAILIVLIALGIGAVFVSNAVYAGSTDSAIDEQTSQAQP